MQFLFTDIPPFCLGTAPEGAAFLYEAFSLVLLRLGQLVMRVACVLLFEAAHGRFRAVCDLAAHGLRGARGGVLHQLY